MTGTVFEDFDINGVVDMDDRSMHRWRVFIDIDNDGELDTDEPSTLSDDGQFSITIDGHDGTDVFLRAIPGAGSLHRAEDVVAQSITLNGGALDADLPVSPFLTSPFGELRIEIIGDPTEGDAVTLRFLEDPEGPRLAQSWTIDWGDGAIQSGATISLPFERSHVYGDSGNYEIKATATIQGEEYTAFADASPIFEHDTSFGPAGWSTNNISGISDDVFGASAATDSGMMLIEQASGFASFAVVKLTHTGQPDTSFGAGGRNFYTFGTDHTAQAIASLGGGRHAIAGEIDNTIGIFVVDEQGTLDTSFGAAGLAAIPIAARVLGLHATASDGIDLVYSIDGTDFIGVTRFTQTGALDTTFGSGGHHFIDTAASFSQDVNELYDDGEPYVVLSQLITPRSVSASPHDWNALHVSFRATVDDGSGNVLNHEIERVFRIDADGNLAPHFDVKPIDAAAIMELQAMTPLGDGSLLLLGKRVDAGAQEILAAKLASNGELDDSFGVGGIARIGRGLSSTNGVVDAAMLEDGSAVVAMRVTRPFGASGSIQTRLTLARVSTTGDIGPSLLSEPESANVPSGHDWYGTFIASLPDGAVGVASSRSLTQVIFHPGPTNNLADDAIIREGFSNPGPGPTTEADISDAILVPKTVRYTTMTRFEPLTRVLNVEEAEGQAEAVGGLFAEEDERYRLQLTWTDPGTSEDDAVDRWEIDWGDGEVDVITAAGAVTLAYHRFRDVELATVRASAVTAQGERVSATFDDGLAYRDVAVTEIETSTTITALGDSVFGTSVLLEEGATIEFQLEWSDPGDERVDRWEIDWGDETTEVLESPSPLQIVSHVYPDDVDSGIVQKQIVIRAFQDGAQLGADSNWTASIFQAPPEFDIYAPPVAYQGSALNAPVFLRGDNPDQITQVEVSFDNRGDTITETFVRTDPDLEGTWDAFFAELDLSGEARLPFVVEQGGEFTIDVRLRDSDGWSETRSFDVDVTLPETDQAGYRAWFLTPPDQDGTQDGLVHVDFAWDYRADTTQFDNEVGFYYVLDEQGGLYDPETDSVLYPDQLSTEQQKLRYQYLAISQGVRVFDQSTSDPTSAPVDAGSLIENNILADRYIAFWVIQAWSVEDWLDSNGFPPLPDGGGGGGGGGGGSGGGGGPIIIGDLGSAANLTLDDLAISRSVDASIAATFTTLGDLLSHLGLSSTPNASDPLDLTDILTCIDNTDVSTGLNHGHTGLLDFTIDVDQDGNAVVVVGNCGGGGPGPGGDPDGPVNAWFSFNRVNLDDFDHFLHTSQFDRGQDGWSNQGYADEPSDIFRPGALQFKVEDLSPYRLNIDPNGNNHTWSDLSYDDVVLSIWIDNVAPSTILINGEQQPQHPLEEGVTGLVVGELTAVDANYDDTHTFTVSLANQSAPGNYSELFEVDGTTLKLSNTESLDYETIAATGFTSITVDVTADDGTAHTTKTFTFDLFDVLEPPDFETPQYNPVIVEHMTGWVGTFNATIPTGEQLNYEIVGGSAADAVSLAIPTLGVIFVSDTSKFNYELLGASPTISIRAYVEGEESKSSIQTFAIPLSNVTETGGEIHAQTFTVPEDAPVGTLVGVLEAFSEVGEQPTLEIIDPGTLPFTLDPNTWELHVDKPELIDLETQQKYNFTVRATDSTGSNEAVITIDLTDRNEAPVILTVGNKGRSAGGDKADFNLSVDEDALSGHVVGAITASDPEGQQLVFEIVAGNESPLGGSPFGINPTSPNTADLVVTQPDALDFESKSVYSLIVRVTDLVGDPDGDPNQSDFVTIDITVADVAEAVIASSPQQFAVGVDAPISSTVGYVNVADRDVFTPDHTITVTGGDTSFFAVNAQSGEITLLAQPTLSQVYTLDLTSGPEATPISIEITAIEGAASGVLLDEDDRLITERRFDLLVPAADQAVRIELDAPNFLADGPDWWRDGFELALLNADGSAAVPTTTGDAFYSRSASGAIRWADGVRLDGNAIEVDASTMPAGVPLTLVARLVNNEQLHDPALDSNVLIRRVHWVAPGTPTPTTTTETEVSLSPIAADFDELIDVTSGIDVTYAHSSFDSASRTLTANLALDSNGLFSGANAISGEAGPMLLVVRAIDVPGVTLTDATGATPDGAAYIDISSSVFSTQHPFFEQQSGTRSVDVTFDIPTGTNPERFGYALSLVAAVNAPPQIESEPVTSHNLSGGDYEYQVAATDPEGDAVSYRLRIAPAGMSINQETGLISWTKADFERFGEGTYTISVVAYDQRGAESPAQTFQLSIAEIANRAPRFDSEGVTIAFANTNYAYTPLITDADGDDITLSAVAFINDPETGEPDFTQAIPPEDFFVTSDNTILWNPDASLVGSTISVFMIANDGTTDVITDYDVEVRPEPGNHAPQFVTTPVDTIRPSAFRPPYDYEYVYDADAVDADGDDLEYELIQTSDVPLDRLVIDPESGRLSWTGDIDAVGEYDITIRVTDGRGGATDQQFTLVVEPPRATGVVTGLVYHDQNDNSMLDEEQTFIAGDADIVYVIDTSGSTRSNFAGTIIGVDTILQAEVAAFQWLTRRIRESSPTDVNVGIVTFSTNATTELTFRDITSSSIDAELDALFDSNPTGMTDFNDGLSNAWNLLTDLERSNIIFISDGYHNQGPITAFSQGIRDDINVLGFGAGLGASLAQLTQISDIAEIFTNEDGLISAISNLGFDEQTIPAEPGLQGWTVYADANNNSRLDEGEYTATTDSLGRYYLELPVELDGSAAEHTIRVQKQNGWRGTEPVVDDAYTAVVEANSLTQVGNFGFIEGEDPVIPGSLSGTVFEDLNANGVRDTALFQGDVPEATFVIDISGSTLNPFEGGVPGVDTILDAELEGVRSAVQLMIDSGFGDTASVSLVAFDGGGHAIDMDGIVDSRFSGEPFLYSTTPNADIDGDGINDIEEALEHIKTLAGGGTDFYDALQETIHVLEATMPEPGDATVIFMSDGQGVYYEELVSEITDVWGADLKAVGVGGAADMVTLLQMDPNAVQYTDLEGLLAFLSGTTSEFAEDGVDGVLVGLDLDSNGSFDQFQVTSGGGYYTFSDVPAGDHSLSAYRPAGYSFWTKPIDGVISDLVITDGTDLDGLNFGLGIDAPNTAPRFTATPGDPSFAYVDHQWTFQLHANDIDFGDNDQLTFTLAAGPEGMAIHPQLGHLTWTPTTEQIGDHTVVVRVLDLEGGVETRAFDILVSPNRAPEFTTEPVLFFDPLDLTSPFNDGLGNFRYAIETQDPDGDTVALDLYFPPDGTTLSTEGVLHLDLPETNPYGDYELTIRAFDDYGGLSVQSFTLRVAESNNEAIFGYLGRTQVQSGQPLVIKLDDADTNGDPLNYTITAQVQGTAEPIVLDNVIPFDYPTQIDPLVWGRHFNFTGVGSGALFDNVLLWLPPPDLTGESIDFTVTAEDHWGNTQSETITADVIPFATNAAPEIAYQEIPIPRQDELYQVQFSATEPDGDFMFWLLDAAPEGMTIDPLDGEITWLPGADDVGRFHEVVIVALDAYGAFDYVVYELPVFADVIPPVVLNDLTEGKIATEAWPGYDWDLQLIVQDFDTPILDIQFTLGADAPAWVNIDSQIPGRLYADGASLPDDATDPFVFTVDVFDGDTTVSTMVSLKVHDSAPPRIVNWPPIFAADTTEAFSGFVYVTDPDPGDTPDIWLENAPPGMVIGDPVFVDDQWRAEVTWQNPTTQWHTHPVTVNTTDGVWNSSQPFLLLVASNNQPPSLDLPDEIFVQAGAPYSLQIFNYIYEDSGIILDLAETPEDPSYDLDPITGQFTWTNPIAGDYAITFVATDPWGLDSAPETVTFRVIDDQGPPQVDLELFVGGTSVPIVDGATLPQFTNVDLSILATDDSGITDYDLAITDATGQYFVNINPDGTLQFNFGWPELDFSNQVTFTGYALDAVGNWGQDAITVDVGEPDTDYPVVGLNDIDLENPVFNETFEIFGSAFDPDGSLADWQLTLIPDFGDEIPVLLAQGTHEFENDPITIFNPSQYPEGFYRLKLEATDLSGNIRSVTISNLRIEHGEGQGSPVTLDFQDMQLQATTGVPVNFTRTYDPQLAAQGIAGDFGVGWRSNLEPVQAAVTHVSAGSLTDDSQLHIKLPGGQDLVFEFDPIGSPLFGYSPNWTLSSDDESGLTAFLTIENDATFLQRIGDEYLVDGWDPYNPLNDHSAVLSIDLGSGIQYRIDARDRELIESRAPNGARTLYSHPGSNTLMHAVDETGTTTGTLEVVRSGGRVTAVRDVTDTQNIVEVQYIYSTDGENRLKEVVSPVSVSTTLTYAGEQGDLQRPDQLTVITDARGVDAMIISYEPDTGLVSSILDPTGEGAALTRATVNNADIVSSASIPQLEIIRDHRGNPTRRIQHLTVGEYTEDENTQYIVTFLKYDYTADKPSHESLPVRVTGVANKYLYDEDLITWATINTYDDEGRLERTIDAEGGVTEYHNYDEFDNAQLIIDAEGAVTERIYDVDGRLLETRGPTGPDDLGPVHTVRYHYDDEGRLESTTELDDMGFEVIVERRTYDESGRPNSLTDDAGRVTHNAYDDRGRLIYEWIVQDNAEGVPVTIANVYNYDAEDRETDTAIYELLGVSVESGAALATAIATSSPRETTQTIYNNGGHVESKTDATGVTTTTKYDIRGKSLETSTAAIDDVTGEVYLATARFAYDSAGREIAKTDPFLVDPQTGAALDPTQIVVHVTIYDQLGRSVERRTLSSFSSEPITIQEHPALPPESDVYQTHVVDYTAIPGWDSLHLTSWAQTTYDDSNRAIFETNSDGLSVHRAFDNKGRQILVAETYDHNNDGMVTALDLEGEDGIPDTGEVAVSRYEYDRRDRVIRKTNPDGIVTERDYDGTGREIETRIGVGTPLLTVTSAEYDRRGRQILEVDALGNETRYTYDAIGNLTSVTLPSSQGTPPTYFYQYDEQGNRTDIFDPTQAGGDTLTPSDDDPHSEYHYDQRGRQTARSLPLGQTERWFYDDRSMTEVSPNPALRADSTGLGQLAVRVDLDGNIIVHKYNNTPEGGGRLSSVDFYHTKDVSAVSDEASLQDVLVALEGITPYEIVRSAYDALGRQVRVETERPGEPVRIVEMTYDKFNRVTSYTSPEGAIHHDYDGEGRVIRTATGAVGTPDTETHYGYDELGRIEHVVQTHRETQAVGTESITLNGQALVGEVTTYYYELDTGAMDYTTLYNGIVTDYEFDDLSRLTKLTHYAPTGGTDPDDFTDNDVLSSYEYELREDGRRIAATETFEDGAVHRFAWDYDDLGRVTLEAYQSPVSSESYVHQYAFDATGNRLEHYIDEGSNGIAVPLTVDGSGFLTFDDADAVDLSAGFDQRTTSTHDDNDRLLEERVFSSDGTLQTTTQYIWDTDPSDGIINDSTAQLGSVTFQGDPSQQDVESSVDYEYDAMGRLSAVQFDDDGDGTRDRRMEYRYDDDGLRFQQTEISYEADGQTESERTTTQFVIDRANPTEYAQVLEEKDEAGNIILTYVIGADVIAQAGDALLALLADGKGTTRQVADENGQVTTVAQNEAGQDVSKLIFDAYGNTINFKLLTALTKLLYAGEMTDLQTGLQYLRARYYDAATGRFNRIDPVDGDPTAPQSLHKYLYVHGDPINAVDPSGESWINVAMMFLSLVFIVGFGTAAALPVGGWLWLYIGGIVLNYYLLIANLFQIPPLIQSLGKLSNALRPFNAAAAQAAKDQQRSLGLMLGTSAYFAGAQPAIGLMSPIGGIVWFMLRIATLGSGLVKVNNIANFAMNFFYYNNGTVAWGSASGSPSVIKMVFNYLFWWATDFSPARDVSNMADLLNEVTRFGSASTQQQATASMARMTTLFNEIWGNAHQYYYDLRARLYINSPHLPQTINLRYAY